jgi:hypothetical protein
LACHAAGRVLVLPLVACGLNLRSIEFHGTVRIEPGIFTRPRSPVSPSCPRPCAPQLAVGDGALGFWKAVRQIWPAIREQRCWVHKTANVLDKLPKAVQPKAKEMLQAISQAPRRAEADKAFDVFLRTYEATYPKAAECLAKDRDALLTFYAFPAEHWRHIRTTNGIESVFATVRLRTGKTKGSGTRIACLTMVFKLMESASRRWRALNGSPLPADVIARVVFVDGVTSKTPPDTKVVPEGPRSPRPGNAPPVRKAVEPAREAADNTVRSPPARTELRPWDLSARTARTR